jgi:nitrite reductase/ring-hydroxylating ferredoxin subunit
VTRIDVQPEMKPVKLATWSEVPDRTPVGAVVEGIDLVIVRDGEAHSVLYGRCLHRGALLADGHVDGGNLLCGLHGWDYCIETGVSAYNNAEVLEKFTSWLEGDGLFVDARDVEAFKMRHPQPYDPDVYQGYYRDPHMVPEEPFVAYIHELAANGLTKTGHHGPVAAMGVSREQLPSWDHIQFVTAQLDRLPQLDDVPVGTEVCIGPNADRPLWLDIPIFVSDMSFGALSQEAKTALARGAELAGTGICSGEGGMLPEEQAENTHYFYELASARFGWSFDHLAKVQAFHFKGGQGAKTGTGGHLPGDKVMGRIAEVRGLEPGTPAVSPATFPDWHSPDDFRRFADEVRERSGGIPIGFKMSAQHIDRRRPGGRRRLPHRRWARGRDRCRAAGLPRPHLRPDDPCARSGAGAPRPPRPARRHPHRHRRAAPRARLRQGARARRRRSSRRQLRHPGDRLPRHARVPHEQLPGGDSDPEAALARSPAGRRSRAAAEPLPQSHRRADAGARPGVRTHAPARVHPRRSRHVRP